VGSLKPIVRIRKQRARIGGAPSAQQQPAKHDSGVTSTLEIAPAFVSGGGRPQRSLGRGMAPSRLLPLRLDDRLSHSRIGGACTFSVCGPPFGCIHDLDSLYWTTPREHAELSHPKLTET
jgi:hypothetical protein